MWTNYSVAYLVGGAHDGVEGWLGEGAIAITTAISWLQDSLDVFGAVGEIGVHHGRYFIALALLRKEGEKAVALDVFEDQHLNIDHSGCGNRAMFEANVKKYTGGFHDIHVEKVDSTTVGPADLLGYAGGQQYRLMSIDGGHTVKHVLNDLQVVEKVLADLGVVILDDYYNPDWPGVNEGTALYLSSNPSLLPFAYGNNKLFLCKRAAHPTFFDWVKSSIVPSCGHHKLVELSGTPAFHLHPPNLASLMRR